MEQTLFQKAKEKIFNRAFNKVKQSIHQDPFLHDYAGYLLDKIKSRKAEIESPLPERLGQFKEQQDPLSDYLAQQMLEIVNDIVRQEILPDLKAQRAELEKVLTGLDDLFLFVTSGGEIPTSNCMWGGAGVIISFPDDEGQESDGEGIVVIRSQFARQLSWLFEQLRDICEPYLNYLTKYEFFGNAARTALKHLQARPESEEALRKSMAYCVYWTSSLIRRSMGKLNRELESGQDFIKSE